MAFNPGRGLPKPPSLPPLPAQPSLPSSFRNTKQRVSDIRPHPRPPPPAPCSAGRPESPRAALLRPGPNRQRRLRVAQEEGRRQAETRIWTPPESGWPPLAAKGSSHSAGTPTPECPARGTHLPPPPSPTASAPRSREALHSPDSPTSFQRGGACRRPALPWSLSEPLQPRRAPPSEEPPTAPPPGLPPTPPAREEPAVPPAQLP